MTNHGVVVLGIPIPSSSPLFLSIVAVHVVAGLVCTVAGIVAMVTAKRAGRHPAAAIVLISPVETSLPMAHARASAGFPSEPDPVNQYTAAR